MKSIRSPFVKVPTKAPTGAAGFDEITGGGLPHGRMTLRVGGPGSGKTIFALRFLVHGARDCKEPGIFVAFLADGILMTPSSSSRRPPVRRVIGTLTQTQPVLQALGLKYPTA